jgi:hypothetical protein
MVKRLFSNICYILDGAHWLRLILDEAGNRLLSQVYGVTIQMHNHKKTGDRLPTLRNPKRESSIARLALGLGLRFWKTDK